MFYNLVIVQICNFDEKNFAEFVENPYGGE